MQNNIGFWKKNMVTGYAKKQINMVEKEGLFVDNVHQRHKEEIFEYDGVNDFIAQKIIWQDYLIQYSEEEMGEAE